jgi:hypothetical protein
MITITITDDMHRMLCGLVRGDVDTSRVIGDDPDAWDRLRDAFPAAGYSDLPADEDGVANAGWGTALMTADDYEPGEDS